METLTLWACVDCAGGTEGTPDAEPWGLWQDGEHLSITMGLMSSEHYDPSECADTECECESRDFSWSDCDGCGSSLGGSREAFTYHYTTGE